MKEQFKENLIDVDDEICMSYNSSLKKMSENSQINAQINGSTSSRSLSTIKTPKISEEQSLILQPQVNFDYSKVNRIKSQYQAKDVFIQANDVFIQNKNAQILFQIPKIDLSNISQPDEVFKSYNSLFRTQIFFAYLFELGSLMFILSFPILACFYLQLQNLTDSKLDQTDVIKITLSVMIVSSFFKFCAAYIFKKCSQLSVQKIKYDLFSNQMCQIQNIQLTADENKEKIDFQALKQTFDLKIINEQLKVYEENFCQIGPNSFRAKFLIALSFVMMILISWKLSLIFFGLFLLFSLISICIKSKYENIQEQISQQSIERILKLQNMGFRENANFTNVSIQIEEDRQNQKNQSFLAFIMGLHTFIFQCLSYFIICSLIYFSLKFYNKQQDALARLNQLGNLAQNNYFLLPFFIYCIYFLYNVQYIQSQIRSLNISKLQQAENKLFYFIKLKPSFQIIQKVQEQKQNESLDQQVEQMSFESFNDGHQDLIVDNNKMELFKINNNNNYFLGNLILVNEESRKELPFKIEDQPVPFFKIIKKFIGQDFTRISLPVILNEPLSAQQKICEAIVQNANLYKKAANTQDSLKRAIYTVVGLSTSLASAKLRKRKPFNPMLGETFEMVTDQYKFMIEKVMHVPEQINCYEMEGKDYIIRGYNKPKVKFSIYGGRGMVQFQQVGQIDCHFKNFDENLTITRPDIFAKNFIWGGLFVDLGGQVVCINHNNNEKVILNFIEKTNYKNSHVVGEARDNQGNLKYTIEGSWLSEIKIRDVKNNSLETVWQEIPLLKDANLQYFFNKYAVLMNFKSEEMTGIVSPTDSRFREDIRLYEQGQIEEADRVKTDIEEEQRRKRALQENNQMVWTPMFFEQVEHPFLKQGHGLNINVENPVIWKMKQGEKGYWQRREKREWSDMPNLFGPFQ